MKKCTAVTAALGLLGCAGLASADMGCSTLLDTATEAGLTFLVQAITLATPSLQDTENGPALLTALSVADTLPTDDRVTVFAPTDAAFTAAGARLGGLNSPDLVADVILNHVVPGDLTADVITELLGMEGGSVVVTTLLGSELFVTANGSSLYVQSRGLEAPGALVTTADVITCVGPVHVIDDVLTPTFPDNTTATFDMEPSMAPAPSPAMEPSMVPAPSPAMEPSMAEECAVLGATAADAGLTSLVDAITAAAPNLMATEPGAAVLEATDVNMTLPSAERVTVFAPTNAAFTAAAAKFPDGALPEDAVADVLLNHVVPGDLTAAAITETLGASGGSVVVTSLLGSELYVSTNGSNLFLQSGGLVAPGALVVTADVITCVGPVHVINTVLLPTFPNGTIAEFDIAPAPAPVDGEDATEESMPDSGTTVAEPSSAVGTVAWTTRLAVVATVLGIMSIL